jgi:hypothetical protein
MRFGSTLALGFVLGTAASAAALAQTSPWPSSSSPSAQAAPAATPAKPATAAKPAAAKPAARKTAAKPKPGAATAAVPAAPALTPEQSGALKFTCSSETRALCQGVAAGSPESYLCLQAKPDQLSSDCRVSVLAVEEANAVEVDPDAPAMPAAPAARPRPQQRAQQPR